MNAYTSPVFLQANVMDKKLLLYFDHEFFIGFRFRTFIIKIVMFFEIRTIEHLVHSP